MTDEITKKIEAYIVVNWKDKSVIVFKRPPKTLGAFQIPIKLDLILRIPTQEVIVAKGDITIPRAKAEDIVVESI